MKRAVRANGRLCFCDLRGIAGAGELSARGRHGGRGVTALTMRRTGGAGSGHAGRGMWPAIPYMAARGLSQKNKPVQSGGRRRGRAVLSRRVVRRRRAGGKPPFAQCGGNTCSGSTSSPAARGGVASRSQLPSVVRGCANTRTRAGAWGRGRACHAWPGTRTEKPTGRCTGSAKCLLLAVQARAGLASGGRRIIKAAWRVPCGAPSSSGAQGEGKNNDPRGRGLFDALCFWHEKTPTGSRGLI